MRDDPIAEGSAPARWDHFKIHLGIARDVFSWAIAVWLLLTVSAVARFVATHDFDKLVIAMLSLLILLGEVERRLRKLLKKQTAREYPSVTGGPEDGGIYVRLSGEQVHKTREYGNGILIDFDTDGQPIGVEIL